MFGEIAVLVAAALALILAVGGAFSGPRGFSRWAFAAGMALLAAEAFCAAQALGGVTRDEILFWNRYRLALTAAVPAIWLVFSLSYSRGNAGEFLQRWRWLCLGYVVVPLSAALLWPEGLFERLEVPVGLEGLWVMRLGWLGKALKVSLVVGAVLVLMNLERTFRMAAGVLRWRIKYIVLGVGLFFTARIFTASQALLFSGYSAPLLFVSGLALLLCCLSIGFSILRSKAVDIEVYPSHAVLRHSLSAMLVGVYLLTVGLFARLVAALGGTAAFELKALLILLAIIGLAALLLSDRLRQRLQLFVSRHFRRPAYDYRRVWSEFTAHTTSILEERELARAVAKLLAQTFNLLSVNVWLVDTHGTGLTCAASTVLTPAQLAAVSGAELEVGALAERFRDNPGPLDLDSGAAPWLAQMARLSPDFFGKGGNRVVVPLLWSGELLGLISVADRVSGLRFTVEDYDLLKCLADQVGASLHNLTLARQLVQAKELEAFQAMSAFVVHDLKNTASTLSLMTQNMAAHFDNPAFRADAIRGLAKSAEHIADLVGRLNQVRQALQLRQVEVDLGALIAARVAELERAFGFPLVQDLAPVPKLSLDPEQFGSVLTNLLLNARDAVGAAGQIRIATAVAGSWVRVSFADNGCGMAPEYVQHSLFKPFQTTKKKGLGIGLYQSKLIVEAHQGRIEVQSQLGKGTTFTILLPLPGTHT